MRVLLLGLNYDPEPIGIAVYTAGLARGLAEHGRQVHVVTAKPYYPQWRILPGFGRSWRRAVEGGVTVTRCPLYVPKQPSGAKRILHYLSFAATALPAMLVEAIRFRPHIVVAVAPSLIAAPVAWLAAKLCGAKTLLHIQDFEVEAAFATGLLDGRSKAARLARAIEHRIVRLFDRVSSISPEMCTRLRGFGVPQERIIELRNWASIDAAASANGDSYRRDWDIRTPHVALYSGNIANKQGIEIIVEAAERLKHRSDLSIVICGEGATRAKLEAAAAHLPGVQIRDLQPVERLPELLALATVHLLPQKADAADLVLPSKLTNMLASGRPVVATAAPGTGLAREVDSCGQVVPPGDAGAFAAAIEKLIDDPDSYRASAASATCRAEARWSRSAIIGDFSQTLEAFIEDTRSRGG